MVSLKTYTLLRLIIFWFAFVLTGLCHIGFNNFTEAYLLSKGEFIATPPPLRTLDNKFPNYFWFTTYNSGALPSTLLYAKDYSKNEL